jgi:AGAP011099-PA
MTDYYADLSECINFSKLADPSSRFKLIKVIGEGTYSEVFSALDKVTGNRQILTSSMIIFKTCAYHL